MVFPASRADKLCQQRRKSRSAQQEKGRGKNTAAGAVRYPRGRVGEGKGRAGKGRSSQLRGRRLAAQFPVAVWPFLTGEIERLPHGLQNMVKINERIAKKGKRRAKAGYPRGFLNLFFPPINCAVSPHPNHFGRGKEKPKAIKKHGVFTFPAQLLFH